MPETRSGVIGGVDTHSRTHHAVALDDRGERLGDAEFPATARGYRELHQWLEAFGTIATIAVEGTSSYGAGLTRWLLAQGLDVREVNQPHRHTRRRQGKSDPIDAEAAARQVLAGTAQVLPKATNGVVESIRTLANARSAAVKARSAALLQLRDLIATAPTELREALPQQTLPAKARQCARFRPDRARLDQPLQAAKLALRSVAHHVAELDREVADLDQALRSLVERVAPSSLALLGVGIVNAAQLLVTAGENIGRLSSEAAFARLCGAAPLEASSGRTQRHRLNPGGDRQANSALYRIVLVRLRYCARTRAYVAKRTAGGKSKREIIRCLKRYVARQLYRTLTADLARYATQLSPGSTPGALRACEGGHPASLDGEHPRQPTRASTDPGSARAGLEVGRPSVPNRLAAHAAWEAAGSLP